MICNQANYGNIGISMKWSFVSLELLDPNSEKMEGIYKADNFINDIAFGASLFFCNLNTYLQLKFTLNFSESNILFKYLKIVKKLI